MHPIDDPFGGPAVGGTPGGASPGGNDRTLIMPRPGGRAADATAPRADAASFSDPTMAMPGAPVASSLAQGLNPLERAGGPILALLTRLRSTIAHPQPASLRAQLLAYLRQFEEQARAAGVAQPVPGAEHQRSGADDRPWRRRRRGPVAHQPE